MLLSVVRLVVDLLVFNFAMASGLPLLCFVSVFWLLRLSSGDQSIESLGYMGIKSKVTIE